ncbi:hypothetical protein [uncultured Cohaesibacter sp.]|uniref:hypothetical protein n=1 Tax=uncultured Cohaesibacter sp. TaxID=1002546 RepID=UPI002931816C|nr:hypothetical protein [uncultured Cohaesibacter sp.]
MGVIEPQDAFAIDMHFHANVFRRSNAKRRRISLALSKTVMHLDGLCSTEHAYKDPIEAYDFLDAMVRHHGLKTWVIPGLENISKEGVEVIQLFPTRKALVDAVEKAPAFSWSIHDVHALRRNDGILVLPHPFSPSNTGIVTGIGLEKTRSLLQHFDYIEMSNGSFLEVPIEMLPATRFKERIAKTTQFPSGLVPAGVGQCYGSDAHRPEDLNLFSLLKKGRNESMFETLSRPQKLKPIYRSMDDMQAGYKITRSLLTSSIEYMQKQDYKLSSSGFKASGERRSLSKFARDLFVD